MHKDKGFNIPIIKAGLSNESKQYGTGIAKSVLTTPKKSFRSVIATLNLIQGKPLSYLFSFLFIGIFSLLILSGCGKDNSGLLSTTNTENITGDTTGGTTGGTTSTTDLSGKVRLRSTVSISSGKPSSEIANATVYAIGQESSKTTTNSNGEFTLLIDAKQSGTVLQKSRALPRMGSTPPAKNQYGIIIASNTREHGKKFEITGNDGDDITLPSPVEITEVGSISGKVTLQNQTDNTGIMVYIPGTSFMALTNASGSFTISNVPEGTYLILRAEKDGYNYSALSHITVQSNKTTTVANQMLFISTGAKGSILINNGASITTSRTVDINISATDNAVLMTIAEEPTFQNVSWITFQSYTTHTFISDGDKTLYIKFADANGLESNTYSDSITIDTNPRITLSSPSGTISLTKPTLTWTTSTLPNPKYHVQVSTDSTFSSILEEATNLTSTSYTLTNILSNAVAYYYRVSIIDENGKEWNWSDTGQFTIDLSTVTLTSPTNASVTNDTTPTFSWSANSNADTYNLVVSTNSNLSSPVVNRTGIKATSFTDTSALSNTASTTYYWAVTPVDVNGVSGTRSSIYSFTLDTTAPAGSVTINSGDASTIYTSVTLSLSASDAVGVTGYYASESSVTPSANITEWTSVTSITSYSATVNFILSSGDGTKTVYVWFKDAASNISSSASDSITLTTTVTDIEGNVYNMVVIGTQVWMKENLKVTKYRNGDAIPTTTSTSISDDSSSKYQWAYNDNENNVATYGRLYTWSAATDSRGLCPIGWHLPTDDEWTTLTDYLGGASVAGGKMKEAGKTHWDSPNTGADNSSGFTALPGGYRDINVNGSFGGMGYNGFWWSATENNATSGRSRNLNSGSSNAYRNLNYKLHGLSIRCLSD